MNNDQTKNIGQKFHSELIDPFIHLRPVNLPPPEPGTVWPMDFWEEIPDEEWAAMQSDGVSIPCAAQTPSSDDDANSPAHTVLSTTSERHPQEYPSPHVGVPATVQPAPAKETIHPSLGKRSKPTAYDVAQELIRREKLLCVGNALYRFDGRVYRILRDQDLNRFIMDSCRSAVAEVGDASFVERIYKVLFSEPAIAKKSFDLDPNIVVLEDGVLDTRNWHLYPPDPSIFATSYIKASYGRGERTSCPAFDRFVTDIAGGEETLICRIWQALGYILSQDMRGKCFVVFQGVSDSGKSVLGNFIRGYFDSSDEVSLDINSFAKNFALADIIGKRLCTDLDLPGAVISSQAISFLKKLTGGDSLSTDVKYMPRITFTNTAKLLFATNHPIFTAQPDCAFFRRLVVIPFRFAVQRELQNNNLTQMLSGERDAVAVRALRYYAQLRDHNYVFAGNYPPNQVCEQENTDSENTVSSAVAVFLNSSCELDPEAWTATSELYKSFSARYPGAVDYRGFSSVVDQLALPGVQKCRKRTQPGTNPVSGFQGIMFKED